MASYPTASTIRESLLARAELFRKLTGTSLSAIGKSAVNDAAFLFQAKNGRNFTVDSYDRVQGWLDQNWPRA